MRSEAAAWRAPNRPSALALIALIPPVALSASVDPRPAAREHVRIIGGNLYKFTSRLSHMVELNFTMGYDHADGKRVLSQRLDSIARAYALDGRDAFTVRKIIGPVNGSGFGVPAFSLDDLLSGQVIVANNIGNLSHDTLGAARRSAIQAAVDSAGRGWLAFHGTAEIGSKNWKWCYDSLDPRRFTGHTSSRILPVYKERSEAKHLVLQGILESGTETAEVPDGVDSLGMERLAVAPVRRVRHEP